MSRLWEATSVINTTINGTSFCGRKINWEPTEYNHKVHLLLQNWHGGTGELCYMKWDNKSVMAIHWGTKQQYRVYNLFCSNTLGSFLITSSLPNLGTCYRLDNLYPLFDTVRMNRCECEAHTVAGCPTAQVCVYFDFLCVYTLQKLFTQVRCKCKLQILVQK